MYKEKEKKTLWERVYTELEPYQFTGREIDCTQMHRAITKQKHGAWKMMIEQLLEEDMNITLEGDGNILRMGDQVYDTWTSVDRWLWCITHRFDPNVINVRDEFG